MKLQQLEAIHLYIPAQYYSGKRFPFLFVHYLSNRTEITPLNKKLSLNHLGVRFDQEDGYGLPLILVQPDRRRGFPDISLSLQVFLNERKKSRAAALFYFRGYKHPRADRFVAEGKKLEMLFYRFAATVLFFHFLFFLLLLSIPEVFDCETFNRGTSSFISVTKIK